MKRRAPGFGLPITPAKRLVQKQFGRRCLIGSERIGHALSAIQDRKLIEELKARGTVLELNPTSNVRTGVCASFAEHPLRRYFDAGLLVTLNSDDPAFFGSDVANEYLLAHTEQGFTREELRQLAANSMRASFLPEPAKARLALPN